MAELALVGAAVGAGGTLVGGELAASGYEDAGELRAAGLRRSAGEQRASSQREMFERKRRERLALSTLTARAAATGDAGSQDTLKLAGDIAARGEYQALAELFTGENRARGLEDEADAAIYTGKQKAHATRIGSYFSAASTILKGVGAYAGGGGASLPGDAKTGEMAGYG